MLDLQSRQPTVTCRGCRVAVWQHGVTLIELIIVVALIGIILAVAVPSFNIWIQNSKTRAAAESVLTGIQLARAESVRRNAPVFFDLQPADNAALLWRVGCVTPVANAALATACPAEIQGGAVGEVSGGQSTFVTDTAGKRIIFDTFGRKIITPPNLADFGQLTVGNALSAADGRPQRIIIGAGGTIRMCDPKLAATDARACP